MDYQKYSSVPWSTILQNVICNYAGQVVAAEQTSGTTPPTLSGFFALGCIINNIATMSSYQNFGSVAVPFWVLVSSATSPSPTVANYGVVPITGVVNGSNTVFAIQTGYTVYQIFDGTQYQTAGVNYNISGNTVTFTNGNAPTQGLTAFGITTAIPSFPTVISGTVNGTNLIFTVPNGVVVGQIFDGTQYQPTNTWIQSGSTITFTTGNAPTQGLTVFSVLSPMGSLIPVLITGTVDGTNLVFNVPSGNTILEIFDGTQFLSPSVWSQTGTTITFTSGNTPTQGLNAFGIVTAAVATTVQSPFLSIASSFAPLSVQLSSNYVCNGLADDIVINQAIQSLPSTGGTIYLSRGLFLTLNTIMIDRPVQFVGQGSGLAGRSATDNLYVDTQGITTIRANADVNVFTVKNNSRKLRVVKFQDILVQGFGKNVATTGGIVVLTATDLMCLYNVNITECKVGFYGINMDTPSIIDCSFQWCVLGALLGQSNIYPKFTNCTFADNLGIASLTFNGISYTTMTGGLAISASYGFCTNCVFSRNDSDVLIPTNNCFNAVSLMNCNFMNFSGNTVVNQNGNAIGIIGDSTHFCEGTKITNNILQNFGVTLTANNQIGVFVQKSHMAQIFDNFIGSTLGGTDAQWAVFEATNETSYNSYTIVNNNIFYHIQQPGKVSLTQPGSTQALNTSIDT